MKKTRGRPAKVERRPRAKAKGKEKTQQFRNRAETEKCASRMMAGTADGYDYLMRSTKQRIDEVEALIAEERAGEKKGAPVRMLAELDRMQVKLGRLLRDQTVFVGVMLKHFELLADLKRPAESTEAAAPITFVDESPGLGDTRVDEFEDDALTDEVG